MIERVKAFISKLESGKLRPYVQFIRFGLVGVSNTLIAYAVEMFCYYVLFTDPVWERPSFVQSIPQRVLWTNALAFVISVTNSYFWNSRYVFKNGGKRRTPRQHAAAYLKTVACYALTGLALAPWLKSLLSARPVPGWPYWLASIATLVVTIPLNFVMNKFWAFGEGRREDKA